METQNDAEHNKYIMILVGLIVETCVISATVLSIHGKDYAAVLTIGAAAIGIVTNSAIRPGKPAITTTIPDSTGTINVNTPEKEIVNPDASSR